MRHVPTETAALLLVEQPDARLLRLAAECGGTIVTNDAAFRQTAEERGVPVMTVDELALALAPKHQQGDQIGVQIAKPGRDRNEGIAYLVQDQTTCSARWYTGGSCHHRFSSARPPRPSARCWRLRFRQAFDDPLPYQTVARK